MYKSLKRRDLELPPMLNFEQMLLGEQNGVD
jgi:hypothetical protein